MVFAASKYAATITNRQRLTQLMARHQPVAFPPGQITCANCHWDWPCPGALTAVNSPELFEEASRSPAADEPLPIPGVPTDRS